ncbi:MAG: amino acid-binding protein [Planctomycetia bacterium]|nr:amino acid-binding protein [Planctomycetia bacterium]
MKLQQLSLFLENKPGHLLRVCQKLAAAGINVETMALADTEEFGILRILVKNPEEAAAILSQDSGPIMKMTDVLAVRVPHQPGGLARLLQILGDGQINVEYMYGFNHVAQEDAVIVLRLDKPDLALNLLADNNIQVFGPDELFNHN